MKGFKKRLTPINLRGASPSYSSTSSSSSSCAQTFSHQQLQTSMKLNHSNLIPNQNSNKIPEIIIRALKSYNAKNPTELSFKAGDFLQVTGEAWLSDGSGWFESMDPLSGSRGFVPIHLFQIFSSGGYTPTKPKKKIPSFSSKSEIGHSNHPKPISTHQKSIHSFPSANITGKSPSSQSLITRQPLYGVVRYDFVPQRNNELEAQKGEAIVLIAHSHQEWFVAKPIGRLGGPGLIPVTYVEVKDLATGKGLKMEAVKKLMENNVLPGIEEWKQATAAYRCNSIPLGRFETPLSTSTPSSEKTLRRGVAKSHQQLRSRENSHESVHPPPRQYLPKSIHQDIHVEQTQPVDIPMPSHHLVEDHIMSRSDPLQSPGSVAHWPEKISNSRKKIEQDLVNHQVDLGTKENGFATVEDLRQRYGLLRHASVESFHKEDDEFWFHLRSHFSSPSSQNPTGEETTVLVLYRVYQDFFDFHAELLDTFPDEAGRLNYDKPSIFPKLPEPKDKIDEIICSERVHSLNSYLEELCKLPSYILDCEIFYEFLGPREGDVELHHQLDSSPSLTSHESFDKSLIDQIEKLSHSTHSDLPSKSTHSNENTDSIQHKKVHKSNFSSSSTASFNNNNNNKIHFNQEQGENSTTLITNENVYYRIKIHLKDNGDIIAIRVNHQITLNQLFTKIFDHILLNDQTDSDRKVVQKNSQLLFKDPSDHFKPIHNDLVLSNLLAQFQSRLHLFFSADLPPPASS